MFEIVAIITISTKPNLTTPNPFACPNILEPLNFFVLVTLLLHCFVCKQVICKSNLKGKFYKLKNDH